MHSSNTNPDDVSATRLADMSARVLPGPSEEPFFQSYIWRAFFDAVTYSHSDSEPRQRLRLYGLFVTPEGTLDSLRAALDAHAADRERFSGYGDSAHFFVRIENVGPVSIIGRSLNPLPPPTTSTRT